MAKLTQDMKDIWAKSQVYILATTTRDGKPNGVPVAIAESVSDEEIMVVDNLMYKTRNNLEENPVAAVAYWSPDDHYGYQLKGKTRIETGGERLEAVRKKLKESGFPLNPKALVIMSVDEGYYIGMGKDSSKNLLA
jgi:uncharacterized protein